MKNLFLASILMIGTNALACPDFSGDWKDANGSTQISWKQNGCTAAKFTYVDSGTSNNANGFSLDVSLDGTPVAAPDGYCYAFRFDDGVLVKKETDFDSTTNKCDVDPDESSVFVYKLTPDGKTVQELTVTLQYKL